ncbi:MAG: hypothetical protein M1830_005204 [Pleopsidium flavum]|nr:MAG: hypothetical protein M1830_005204 [Pleopsidium flavum]
MSPVYGSIPASIYHQRLMTVAVLVAWIGKPVLKKHLPTNTTDLIPVLAFSIPTIQFFLFQQSSRLGATYGPLVTEAFTYFPLVLMSVFWAASLLDSLNLGQPGALMRTAGPGIFSYAIFSGAQKISTLVVKKIIGSKLIFTRSGLQLVLATFYALLLPSRLTLLAIIPLLHSASFNVHVPLERPTALLNRTLHANDYSLIARQESLTGYISVLDNTRDGFRVMRCDHSLLGGEWLQQPKTTRSGLREPIYAVFAMLEAVRLVQPFGQEQEQESIIPDNQKSALVIGLGVGTTPSALTAHGINTTTVEIDPVVYEYATKYFGLPTDHNLIIEDALSYVERAHQIGQQRECYDYIIHDVFTGGAEPVDLFTTEFLTGLSDLLKPDGAVAINYAGDLRLPSARLVIHTIKSIFPTCRIFRESAPLSSSTSDMGHDFTNVVVFCTKTPHPFRFRPPGEADFLGSGARISYLLPQHEIDGNILKRREGKEDLQVLRKGRTQMLNKWQKQSAVGHWGIMRTVLPNLIWENW